MPAARFRPFFGKTRDELAHDIWTAAQHGLCHRSERRFSHGEGVKGATSQREVDGREIFVHDVQKQNQQGCARSLRKSLHRSQIHLTAFVNAIYLQDLERFTIWDLQGMPEHDIIMIFMSQ